MEAWYPYLEVSVSEEMEIFDSQSCSLMSGSALSQWSRDAQEEGEGGGAEAREEKAAEEKEEKERKGRTEWRGRRKREVRVIIVAEYRIEGSE